MTDSSNSVVEGRAQALVASPWQASFDWCWFDPDWWGGQIEPVDDGGRGSAWFIESRPPMVLRNYQRGGLVARLSRATYLYLGSSRTRAFAEFHLLQHMQTLGLPVPPPIAAGIWRTNLAGYRAAILVERLIGTRALGSMAASLEAERWQAVGRTIRDFHRAGVCHADLNCFNILLSDNDVYLIDFDKGRLRSAGGQWRQGNLRRLRRSLAKLSWPEGGPGLDQAWEQLLQGYHSE